MLIIVPIKIFGLVNKSFSQYILCNIKEQVITTLCAPHHLITAPILNNHYYKIAKEKSNDLIYFVEDDYIHKKESLGEMILTYEKITLYYCNRLYKPKA